MSVEANDPESLASLVEALDNLARSGQPSALAAGFFTYEAGVYLEGSRALFRPPDRTPLAWFAFFDTSCGADPGVSSENDAFRQGGSSFENGCLDEGAWRNWSVGVSRIRKAISRGDVYQVNLTRRISVPLHVPPRLLADFLFSDNPVPYGLMIETPGFSIVSNSPELFLDVDLPARRIESRPIKGTIRRGESKEEDLLMIRTLSESVKDRAEHIMIVDLIRNDLGRVCDSGGVGVRDLLAVRPFRHLHHLETAVTGRLLDSVDLATILEATLPGGSITGAPKRASLRYIRDLEEGSRGPYTGAIGFVRGDGRAVFNVGIRTAIVTRGRVDYHTGGGIVWDSDPDSEWRETETKAREFRRSIERVIGRPENGK